MPDDAVQEDTGRPRAVPRFATPSLAEMTDAQREIYALFTTGPRAAAGAAFSLAGAQGQLAGPPAVWLLSPPVGLALEKVGRAVRFQLEVPPRAREIVILMTGHHHASPFEIYAHSRGGLAAGLSPADLDALAAGQPPALADDTERAAYAATREILADGTLSHDSYRAAVTVLTERGLFEVVALIGWYSMLAVQLAVFGVQPPGAAGHDEQ